MDVTPPLEAKQENGFSFGDRYCYWNEGRVFCALILYPVENVFDSFKLTRELLAFLKYVHGGVEPSFFIIALYLKFKKRIFPNKWIGFPLDGRAGRKSR